MKIIRLYFKIKNKLFLNNRNRSSYFSQDGQDKYIHEFFFESKKNGFFLDIGANDGITLSNSYFFEKHLNWNGVCIEPNPDTFIQLKKNRKCITLNGAISDHSNRATFLKIRGHSEMLSGLVDFYDDKHLLRIEEELLSYGGEKEEISVQCYQINNLLEMHDVKDIDYLTIDTEGGEFNIINSLDFKKFKIGVVSIENPYNDQRIRKLMYLNNFKLVNILGSDEIYANKKIV